MEKVPAAAFLPILLVKEGGVDNDLRLLRGKQINEKLKNSRDYIAIDHVNEWWDSVANDCAALKRRDAFGAYREFSMARGDA
mgnify:CR=1 FL=1